MITLPELSLLLVLAALVAVATRAAALPYAIALVLAGLALGNWTGFSGPHLTKQLLFYFALPGLLFDAAYRMHFADFWRARVSILALAVPGVVFATFLTAAIVWWALGAVAPGSLRWLDAMLFGALISATDPISVLAIFRALGVDNRLAVIVEAESLFNDGTGIVVFGIVLAMATGMPLDTGGAVTEFVRATGLAALAGGAAGILVGALARKLARQPISIALTVLCAYGTFISAQRLGVSGVITCVVAGLVAGTWSPRGQPPGVAAADPRGIDVFWKHSALVLNSIVFLLIGVEINLASLAHEIPEILLGWIAITVARAVLVFGQRLLMRMAGLESWPISWAAVLTWGGLRGGLSMVLALSLPAELPQRELILRMTFGVVLLTLLVQGLTIKPLLRWLGLAQVRASS